MPLSVLVQVWCEIDPTLHVRLDRATGNALAEDGDALWRVSPLGRLGVATALGLPAAAVTAFALGVGHAEALRNALAAGASRAVELVAAGTNADAVTEVAIAEWLRAQNPSLVIADRVAGLLAGRLGWSHLAGLAELQVNGGSLHALRHVGRGDREKVTAVLPAAVRLQAESLRAPYVARACIQAMDIERIERCTLTGDPTPARAEAGPLQPIRPRTHLGKPAAPAAASANDRLQALLGLGKNALTAAKKADAPAATPDQLAEEFVRYLAHHQLLDAPEKITQA